MALRRIFLIVLDSLGIGNAPDAADFGDLGANTLKTVSKSPKFNIPNLIKLGLGDIEGVELGEAGVLSSCASADRAVDREAVVCRLEEVSKGKDTTIGHWEIAGIESKEPLPVYPKGFPAEIIEEFERATGRKVLCNKPYSGTEVIKDYGEEHVKTGALIVYTSADSVFQIAAHEDIVPVETLYEYCKIARKILTGKHGVGRVIARPFTGEHPYVRTSRRHDFSIEPPRKTILEAVAESGRECIAVGKINDIFLGKGITEAVSTKDNRDGMAKTLEYARRPFEGLCFVNLVDFDMLYGHRNDIDGYAEALSEFDAWLPSLLEALTPEDMVIITADHGCDPGFSGTDHTRECVPMIAVKGGFAVSCGSCDLKIVNLGTRRSFSDIADTVADFWQLDYKSESAEADSFIPAVLGALAVEAMNRAYAPYSEFKVGAALLSKSGKIFTGCNIENASYGASICAERVAVANAVSSAEREFSAIAVAGGHKGVVEGKCAPCGICRQVLSEFACGCGNMKVIMVTNQDGSKYEVKTLAELLPEGFKL